MIVTPVAGIHVWTEHDTWWGVAARYTAHGANWVHIAVANPHVRNPNDVPVGTRLWIPGELLP